MVPASNTGRCSQVTTMVKGTVGYLHPEYYTTQQLTEKSDAYSFRAVLLELICGREPLRQTRSPSTWVLWAKLYVQVGAFESLKETYDEESMRNATSIASRSVDSDASQRPTTDEVVVAYNIQPSYLATAGVDFPLERQEQTKTER